MINLTQICVFRSHRAVQGGSEVLEGKSIDEVANCGRVVVEGAFRASLDSLNVLAGSGLRSKIRGRDSLSAQEDPGPCFLQQKKRTTGQRIAGDLLGSSVNRELFLLSVPIFPSSDLLCVRFASLGWIWAVEEELVSFVVQFLRRVDKVQTGRFVSAVLSLAAKRSSQTFFQPSL